MNSFKADRERPNAVANRASKGNCKGVWGYYLVGK